VNVVAAWRARGGVTADGGACYVLTGPFVSALHVVPFGSYQQRIGHKEHHLSNNDIGIGRAGILGGPSVQALMSFCRVLGPAVLSVGHQQAWNIIALGVAIVRREGPVSLGIDRNNARNSVAQREGEPAAWTLSLCVGGAVSTAKTSGDGARGSIGFLERDL